MSTIDLCCVIAVIAVMFGFPHWLILKSKDDVQRNISQWCSLISILIIVFFVIGITILASSDWLKDQEKIDKQKRVIAEKLIWHVSDFEQHYDCGFVGTYQTDIHIEPVNGKWPYNKPWFNYQSKIDYYFPKDWEAFVKDRNKKFKIKIDYHSTSGTSNTNVNGWWELVPVE